MSFRGFLLFMPSCSILVHLSSAQSLGDFTPYRPVSPRSILKRLKDTNYEKFKPPSEVDGYSKDPTVISFGIFVEGISDISEISMDYSLIVYLRCQWYDPRLEYEGNNTEEVFNDLSILNKIWTPDVFFPSSKESGFLSMLVPNLVVRVKPDGSVFYSRRVTMIAGCYLDLRNYPLDSQNCSLYIESYASAATRFHKGWSKERDFSRSLFIPTIRRTLKLYTNRNESSIGLFIHDMLTKQVQTFRWAWKGIEFDKKISPPELELKSIEALDCRTRTSTGGYNCLKAVFVFHRRIGYHVFQTFIPTMAIVMISWVSFFVNIEAAPARVSLSITTMLTLSTRASGLQAYLPPVSYVKAIDIWMMVCSGFVFAVLVQFIIVHAVAQSEKARFREFESQRTAKTSALVWDGKSFAKENKPKKKKLDCYCCVKAQTIDKISRVLFPLCFIAFIVGFCMKYPIHV